MIFDQEYTKLCSEKTLQSEKEGFFLQFARLVSENVGNEWIRHVFGKLKSDRERIKRIYQDPKISNYVVQFLTNVQEIYRKKCSRTAMKCRSEAETEMKNGNKKKALTLYSQSILRAPKNDETLSLSLLNRAKILISINEYSTALTDLQFVLKEKLSDRHRIEAFWMMSICYKAQNENNKSQVALNLAEKLIGNDKKLLDTLQHSLQVKYEPMPKQKKILPSIKERHPHLNNASKKMLVQTSKEVGRYVIANEEIKIGETLITEEPAVACLFPEKFGTHCHHCFSRFLAPVGCPDCSSVAFCGQKCRDEAVKTYHKYECKYLDLLIGSGMSALSLTALRAVTQQKIDKNFEKLCTNFEKRTPADFLHRTLMAIFLLRCLQKSGFFGENTTVVPTTENEYLIGEKLLLYLQILQFNAHEIFETLYTTDHKVEFGKPAYLGVGVYPTAALLNHDCYPTVTRYFFGKNIVIKSIRPIAKNWEISENYGPIFSHLKLIDRQRILSCRYWFNCQCNACFKDWPLLINLTEFIQRVRCPTKACNGLIEISKQETLYECSKCHQKVNLTENLEKLKSCKNQYETASKFIEDGRIEEAILVLSQTLETFHRISAPPHRETHLAEQALRICFGHSGNTHDALILKS